MKEIIAVETMTLPEVSHMFRRSIEAAFPKAKGDVERKLKELRKAKVTRHNWVQTYEIFKGAKLNFYYQTIPERPSPIASIGMIHRTINGLILVIVDVSNGGISNQTVFGQRPHWEGWVRIYTGHCCERYADRILKVDPPTFQAGEEGIMYSDEFGVAKVIDNTSEEIQEIELQFKDGRYFGYRDSKSKITYFRTVISKEMEKGDQLQFREEWRETLDRLNDLFKWE